MNILLDSRVELNVVVGQDVENVIFCRPIPESLDNVGIFVTNGKEFIYKYEYVDNKKILFADVFLENKEKFSKVAFNIVFTEQANLPKCTFNPTKSKKTFHIIEAEKTAFQPKLKDEIKPVQKLVKKEAAKTIFTKKPEPDNYRSETEVIQEAIKKQNQLQEQEKKIIQEKQALEKQKTIIEKQNFIDDKLSEYKLELLQEYYKASASQEQALSLKIQNNINEIEFDLKDRIINTFNDYNVEFKTQDTLNQKQQYNKLLTKINESIVQNRSELEKFVSEKISLENNNNNTEIQKIAKLLDKNYNDKIVVEIVEAAKRSKKEITDSVKGSFIVERAEGLKTLDKLAKDLEKNYNDKLLIQLEKYKANLFKEFKNISEVEVEKVITENVPRILEKIENKVKHIAVEKVKFDKNIKFSNDQQKYINETAQRWARRILDLGGGGGNVSLQLAKGGTIDGNLTVCGDILPCQADTYNLGTSALRWNDLHLAGNSIFIGDSMITAIGTTIVVPTQEVDGNMTVLDGDVEVTSGNYLSAGVNLLDIFGSSQTVTILAGNSAKWDSSYTTVNAFSGAWSSGLQTLTFDTANADLSISDGNTVNLGSLKSDLTQLAANSASWNSAYTTTKANSGNWETAYNQVGILASQVSFLSGQIDKNMYENLISTYNTIVQFAVNPHAQVNKGYTVTLSANGKVYIFAGNDDANPNHYLELNANPHFPVYVESINNQGTLIIDTFNLADFKSAKYTLQVETNFNNEIYYSELNVVGAISPVQSVVSEYGQIATSNLINSYDTYIAGGFVYLTATFSTTLINPAQNYIIKGLRTNFYRM